MTTNPIGKLRKRQNTQAFRSLGQINYQNIYVIRSAEGGSKMEPSGCLVCGEKSLDIRYKPGTEKSVSCSLNITDSSPHRVKPPCLLRSSMCPLIDPLRLITSSKRPL